MVVTLKPGEIAQEGTLDIHFQNIQGQPCNVFAISYEIVYVDPGPPEVEIDVPPNPRTPANPSVGSYYASFQVPPGATIGLYRVRWTFQETSSSVTQQVVQEFDVASPMLEVMQFSAIKQDCIDKLRVLIRDQCVAAEETVELNIEGELVVVRMDDLWGVLQNV